jgi:hypothetical protein
MQASTHLSQVLRRVLAESKGIEPSSHGLNEKHLSRMPQQTNICLLSNMNSSTYINRMREGLCLQALTQASTRLCQGLCLRQAPATRSRRVIAEGAGLEPANAVIRTAVFKTAALPVMLTFRIIRAGWELNPRYIGFADQSPYRH